MSSKLKVNWYYLLKKLGENQSRSDFSLVVKLLEVGAIMTFVTVIYYYLGLFLKTLG